ncbi:MAG: DNA/RNA non-specific endonuclease [Lachnospiraceae bacterium]|nr:DNA/RNA non-specific endonuclease [Lachnospiraceae bacterium]
MKHTNLKLLLGSLLLSLSLLFGGCSADESTNKNIRISNETSDKLADTPSTSYDLKSIPEYSGEPYVTIHDNVPFFLEEELTTDAFETYSELDDLGRCGTAYANICEDIMPTEKRGKIGMIKPSGWHTVKYTGIDGNYLYNRCHLIGYQLSAENANEKNLITGTRYLNVTGMLPFENMVADYVNETGNHVLYRVTPIYNQENLVADGVLMEAQSVENDDLAFCVYCYNVQPGIEIDYHTGDSKSSETEQPSKTSEDLYVLNRNTKKFHRPNCSSVQDIKPKNKQEFSGNTKALIQQGYSPCKNCNP